MEKLVLNRAEFYDKVFACWLGKNIGGTLGAPYENFRHTFDLTFYEPVPDKPIPNDDLDLQLIWLKLLEERGLDPALPEFAEYWNLYAASYPWNEYGFFMRNYSRGLRPPIAGCFENYFVDEMGSPIRSEIWACLYPGNPEQAARMAWKDSCIDHAGGEGTYGEIFWAAVESAAFVISDPMILIRIGLNMIPISCQISRSIREVLWCYENNLIWGITRERIVKWFGHIQACNAVPNHAFTIIGWLYGKDFGDKLCKAVNCGYDTDCTGATLGALLGIIGGTDAIPEKWKKPIGLDIIVHKFTRNFVPPANIEELTERTVKLAEKMAGERDNFSFGQNSDIPKNIITRLFKNSVVKNLLTQDMNYGVELCDGKKVAFHYGGDPVLMQGIGKEVYVTVDDRENPEVDLIVPDKWKCERLGASRFLLQMNHPVADRNKIVVRVRDNISTTFTMLGPNEAKGFGAGNNVEVCPNCLARIEQCFCKSSL